MTVEESIEHPWVKVNIWHIFCTFQQASHLMKRLDNVGRLDNSGLSLHIFGSLYVGEQRIRIFSKF